MAIKGTDIQHISRHGRDGYMRNFVGPDGKTLMRDVPVELDGELAGKLPCRFAMSSHKLEVLAPPCPE